MNELEKDKVSDDENYAEEDEFNVIRGSAAAEPRPRSSSTLRHRRMFQAIASAPDEYEPVTPPQAAAMDNQARNGSNLWDNARFVANTVLQYKAPAVIIGFLVFALFCAGFLRGKNGRDVLATPAYMDGEGYSWSKPKFADEPDVALKAAERAREERRMTAEQEFMYNRNGLRWKDIPDWAKQSHYNEEGREGTILLFFRHAHSQHNANKGLRPDKLWAKARDYVTRKKDVSLSPKGMRQLNELLVNFGQSDIYNDLVKPWIVSADQENGKLDVHLFGSTLKRSAMGISAIRASMVNADSDNKLKIRQIPLVVNQYLQEARNRGSYDADSLIVNFEVFPTGIWRGEDSRNDNVPVPMETHNVKAFRNYVSSAFSDTEQGTMDTIDDHWQPTDQLFSVHVPNGDIDNVDLEARAIAFKAYLREQEVKFGIVVGHHTWSTFFGKLFGSNKFRRIEMQTPLKNAEALLMHVPYSDCVGDDAGAKVTGIRFAAVVVDS